MNLKLFSTIICLLVFTSSVCDGKIRNHRSSRVKTSSEKTIPAQTSKIRLLKSTTRQAVGKISIYLFNWYDEKWGFWLDSNEPGAKIIDFNKTKYQYKYTDNYYGTGCEYISKENVTRQDFEYNELLLSDIGDSIVFVNNDHDTKIRIIKNVDNGHHILDGDNTIIDSPYIFLIESKKISYDAQGSEKTIEKTCIAPLSVEGDHLKLYQDIKKSNSKASKSYKYGEGAGWFLMYPVKEKASTLINDKGELQKDIDLDYFENHYLNSSIAYLHDINTLYFSGEFYNKKNHDYISPDELIGTYKVVEGQNEIEQITAGLSCSIKRYEVKMINDAPTICLDLDWDGDDDNNCGTFNSNQVFLDGFIGNMSAFLCGYLTYSNNQLKGIMWDRFYDAYDEDEYGNMLTHYYHRFPFPVTLKKVSVETNIQKDVYYSAAHMPSFPGGDGALMKYVESNIKYPLSAKDNNIQGKVVVQFVVTKNGKVGDVKVVKSVDKDLDNEAIRLTKTLPTFSPGRNKAGEPVDVWYTLPLTFKLPSTY